MTTRRIELLAPAKDAATARAAIQCGADAVYIGAERFSAREAAANTISAVQQATDFAHQYYARVYVALNTLLYDDELPLAEKMIHQLYEIGVDGLIIQDVGLLELDLPPLPLIASTQMHNATPEKVKFWQDVGFSRVILARELTLEQIRHIRSETSIELECFIHGALCVSTSGQCYLSYALGGRSGNRGQCAQPCRRLYSLKDRHGKTIVKDRYLLSLKDLNLSDHIEELIDAGIDSFKVEGRLKDIPYVVNTVSFYRQRLDSILSKKGLRRSSSGSVRLNFEPNLEKTFNRGFTNYSLVGRAAGFASINTPKSIGECVGVVTQVEKSSFVLDDDQDLHNADGICFFDRKQNLSGTIINRVNGRRIYPQKMQGIRVGQKIYRNYDHEFSRKLTGRAVQRKIHLSMLFRETPNGLVLSGTDEDGNQAKVDMPVEKHPALKKQAAMETIRSQLTKLGNTIFECPGSYSERDPSHFDRSVPKGRVVEKSTKNGSHSVSNGNCSGLRVEMQDVYFMPLSQLNAAKRELVRRLTEVRATNRPRTAATISKNDIPYRERHLTYMGNVLNSKARVFYRRHGVETIEPAAESGLNMSGRLVMTTKYCLRRQLKLCPKPRSKVPAEPLILQDEDGREYEIHFHCDRCRMDIFLQ